MSTTLQFLQKFVEFYIISTDPEHIPEKHIPEWTVHRKTLGRMDISPNVLYISLNVHLPECTLGRMDISPKSYFPEWTLARMYIWPNGRKDTNFHNMLLRNNKL